ncbi:C2 domain containing 3 centriole elongation regulator [Rhinolophus ferrumequinum]|uniref:C2 domain containing 3 centriole elongation regulator n=1 Tax=Rhinolophus ferrumequinum TaxID=59479 RepID=A0A7J7W5C5_RHIFE|nr:C2 domain containing 3 centriole elongation regulator [Rhinolophus ferrumequinum]
MLSPQQSLGKPTQPARTRLLFTFSLQCFGKFHFQLLRQERSPWRSPVPKALSPQTYLAASRPP